MSDLELPSKPPSWELTERLRKAFDESFALPIRLEETAGERLLSIHAGGEAFALPLIDRASRISGLEIDRVVVPLHSGVSEFLGLIGVGGTLIPAFDLARLAGLAPRASRWMALLRLPASAALVFESMDGLLDVPTRDIRPVAESGVRTPFSSLVDRVARRGDGFLPVLDLSAIGDAIQQRVGSRGSV